LDEENVCIQKADYKKLREIVSTLREELGMSLLGVDVVVENTTGHHAIIDINAYPGYSLLL
jgi:inositol-1,3,4-trisphosphate 5/6-kinase/inositol-tetrakisphosphate 1-kinase